MFQDSRDHYFMVEAAQRHVEAILGIAGAPEPQRILDFPCGHGRVLRYLRAAYPLAEITACDLNRDGVEFCAERLGAVPVMSSEDPADIRLAGEFDLIWCGSLLTHLDSGRWPASGPVSPEPLRAGRDGAHSQRAQHRRAASTRRRARS